LCYTHSMETIPPASTLPFTANEIAAARRYAQATPPTLIDPQVELLVKELIGRVADRWTMMVLEVLAEHGKMRFGRLRDAVGTVSQKMLTQTLRTMERDGLLTRTIHPVVPPHVDYELTGLGFTLSAAFCGVWVWASENHKSVEQSRKNYDGRE
jgi:DNA-binding HxlR family transcriptional regulator